MIKMILFGNKKIYLVLFISIIFFLNTTKALENKIVVKINNEIITSLDINNEANYLKALNKNIQNLSEARINNIAKKSLIREKIKINEILRYVNKMEVDEKYLDTLIKSTYLRLNIDSKNNFLKYIQKFNLNIKEIEKKITIEALWNKIIVTKFSGKIKIDKNDLKKKVSSKNNEKIKSYLLSEILFKVSNKKKLELKYKEIKDSITKVGFENAALIYSISNTSKIGGKLDWIKENSLNSLIRKKLFNLKINDLTKPITTPGGFLILKIQNIKYDKVNLDLDAELKSLIRIETNRQLNQYSNIYFNKIEKDTQIHEQ